MGWVLSVSVAGALSHADTLEISFISQLEYSCQLWNPWKAKDIQAIKAIQQMFRYKITEVQHLNYWERLAKLKLYSLQRCHERYIIKCLKENTAYGAKYWWYNGTQNGNQ